MASPRLHRRCERIINATGHPTSGDDVALFIDWENFKISLAAGNRTPNVSALKEEVSNHGRVVVAKAYADWVTRSPELKGASQFINDPPALYAAGIEPVYVPTRLPLGSPSALNYRTTRVKNSVDVKMTAECIECAHSYPNIGTFVLVSGDSDFIHVVNSLRAIGKQVIIIGVSWSTSRRLADQVDGLILYDFDVDPEVQPEPAPAPAPANRSSRSANANRQQVSDVMRTIEDIVRSERQAGRTPLLTSLKQRIMRRVPGFDEKKLGFSGFKKLILRTAEEGTIKLVTVGLVDWVIMADEPTPVEAMPDSQTGNSSIESVAAAEEVIPAAESQATAISEVVTASETQSSATEDESEKSETDTPVVSQYEELQPALAAESATAEQANLTLDHSSGQTDSVLNETTQESEAFSDATESEKEVEGEPPALSPELERALEETLAQLELPKGPGDGQDGRRVADLVIMADTLEHQEGISHVAFNFLLSEICGALQQGLEAEHPEITGRWGGRIYSRTYVTRLLRGLGDKDVFVRDWHQEKSEETGRSRRFRTFNLNRSHPLVKEAVVSQWGPEAATAPSEADSSPDESSAISESAMPEVVVAASSVVTTSAEVVEPSVNGHDTVSAETAESPAPANAPKKKARRAPTRRKRPTAAEPVPATDS